MEFSRCERDKWMDGWMAWRFGLATWMGYPERRAKVDFWCAFYTVLLCKSEIYHVHKCVTQLLNGSFNRLWIA
jgi:hypothetical protein